MTLDQTIQNHILKLPTHLQNEVLDYVLYLEEAPRRQQSNDDEQRQKMRSVLAHLVEMNPFWKIDPMGWEREQRLERSLQGRR